MERRPYPAREICFTSAAWAFAHFALVHILYHKFRPADEKTSEDVFPAADLPGLSQPGICLMA